jgi:integrase
VVEIENITNEELLQYLVNENIIDTTTILDMYMASKRKEILKKHPCRIWQGKNNGYWYTYIKKPDGKRRLIAKKTREEVEEIIVEHYADEPTINEMFEKWIAEKMHYDEISESSRDRYIADYNKYFADKELRYKKINTISPEDLETFIKDQIMIHDLTSKAYGGLRTIIIGVWGYAYKHKYTDIAIRTFFTELRLSKKIFKHKSQMSNDNVFTDREVKLIEEYLLGNKPNVISYGIILAMRTGLRVGELCSLTKNDVQDKTLRINKTETRYRQDNNTYVRAVKDNAKTDAGNRFVLIDDKALELIKQIERLNPKGEYLFEINGKRCIGQSFTRKLERACNTLGIKPRSMHKCRKTYITTLINAQVPESLIIEQVGHTDIRTSKQFYMFNNKAKEDALRTLSNAVSSL